MTFNEFKKLEDWELESVSFNDYDKHYLYYLCDFYFTTGGQDGEGLIEANKIKIRIDRHIEDLDLMDESKPNTAEYIIEREVTEAVKAHILKLYNLLQNA